MARGFRINLALACLLAASFARAGNPPELPAGPPSSQGAERPAGADVERLQREANAAFERGDYEGARRALQSILDASPRNASAHYNMACANALLGDAAASVGSLHEAIANGFVDFHHLERDEDLAALRAYNDYRLILRGWRELLDERGASDLASYREALGAGYEFATDAALRLNYASAFEGESFEDARRQIERVAAWAAASVFPESAEDPARPEAWVTVVLPTPEHFVRFVPLSGVGGVYDEDRRTLVSQDLGASLRHEFLHVLHHRRMSRLGQEHPIWVQEGLGCLPEDFARGAEGEPAKPGPSWRTNIVKRLAERGRLTSWKALFAMPRERFMGSRPSANYAQARAVFLFLSDKGLLRRWMSAYEGTFGEDPTGVAAFERVFGAPLGEVEREFRAWAAALPTVAEEIRPGMPSLGVVVSPGKGEGPVVEEVVAREAGGARDRSLRIGDVLTSVAGEPTRTVDDLVRALSEHEVGDRVEVRVKRGSLRLSIEVALTAR